MKSFRRFNSLIAMVCVILMMSFVFSFDFVFADDNTTSVDQVNITVPVSCSVVGTIASGGDHTAPMVNSQYLSEIGTTTFKTYCNDNSGYAIYAIGYSNDEFGNTLMKHNSDNTRDFDTGTATSGGTSDWAMKLSAIAGTYAPTIHSDTNGAYTAYHVVPSTYTKVVSFGSNTDLPATGVNAVGSGFTSTYAVWVSATQVAGTYTGKVRYTLVHPSTEVPLQPQPARAGYIVYHPNGSYVVGTIADQSAGDNAEVTLYPSNFSREGYGFAGWSTTFDYSDPTGFYGPMETITTPADTSTNGLSLYAIWVKSAGNLQNWSGCSSLQSGEVTALSDQRDNNTYAVAKLADGNCWMIENLRLDNTNSDNATGALAQGYGTSSAYGNFSGLASPEAPWATNSAAANSLYYIDTQEETATINIGTTDYPERRMPRYNNYNTASRANNTATNANIYSYGNYYTWAAAIADTTYYSYGDRNATSICPIGWSIPTGGGSTKEFSALNSALISGETGAAASNIYRSYPNNFVFSGYVYNSNISSRRRNGGYWSSSSSNNTLAYLLTITDTGSGPRSNGNKADGRSIRCVISGT